MRCQAEISNDSINNLNFPKHESMSGFVVSSSDFKAPKKTEMPLYCPRSFNGPKYKMCLDYKALF